MQSLIGPSSPNRILSSTRDLVKGNLVFAMGENRNGSAITRRVIDERELALGKALAALCHG